MKVLVVDDSETIRAFLNIYLRQHGYEALFARHGAEGLDIARIHKPDFIISDILMPVMDGFRFLSALREDADIRHIPFIFFSGTYTDDKAIELARSLGADGFIAKSQDFENFTEELTVILKDIATKKERSMPRLADGETEFLERYIEIMAVKLEKKVQELEEMNRKIQGVVQSYEFLFNSIRDVIIATDNGHCIIKYNMPIFHEIFGYNDDEIKGKNIQALFDDDDDYALLKKAVFDRKEYLHGKIVEVNSRRKNGDVVRGEVKAVKVIGEYRTSSGSICMNRIIGKDR